MQIDRQAQDWNELAQLDPHWAILTSPGKRFGRWDSDEFFATGTAEAEAFMRRADAARAPAGARAGARLRLRARAHDPRAGRALRRGRRRRHLRGDDPRGARCQRGRRRSLVRRQPRRRPEPVPRRELRSRLLGDRAAARARPGGDRVVRPRVLPCPASGRPRGLHAAQPHPGDLPAPVAAAALPGAAARRRERRRSCTGACT